MQQAWLKHFNISPEYSSCTLQEALKTELISQSDYMKWASYYYRMPILKDQYFKEHPQLNEQLWSQYSNVWSESLIPVLEWNNTVYVAALEPAEISIDKKVVFLLTSTQSLEDLWKQSLAQTEGVSFPEVDEGAGKGGEESKFDEEFYQKKQIPETDIMIESGFLENLKFLLIDKVSAVLNFLFPPPKKQKTSFKNSLSKPLQPIQTFTLDKPPQEEKKEPVVKTPEPEEEKIISMAEESDDSLPLPSEKEEEKKEEKKEEEVKEESEDQTISLMTEAESEPVKEREEEVPVAMAEDDNQTPLKEEALAIEEDKKEEEPLALEASEPASQEENKDEENKDEEKKEEEMDDVNESLDPVTKQLEATRKHIDSYILFSFKKDHFVPIKWSEDLQPKKKAKGNTKSPSIFRICYTSKQPYCGKMAPVISNNYFFENWGFETLPTYVVMIPFVHNGKVMGGYLGISKDHVYSINFLGVIDKIIQPLSEYYKNPKLLKKIS